MKGKRISQSCLFSIKCFRYSISTYMVTTLKGTVCLRPITGCSNVFNIKSFCYSFQNLINKRRSSIRKDCPWYAENYDEVTSEGFATISARMSGNGMGMQNFKN